MACSRIETLLLSPTTGDVLVCRDRADEAKFTTRAKESSRSQKKSHQNSGASSPSNTAGYCGPMNDGHSASSSFEGGGICFQCQQWTAKLAETPQYCQQWTASPVAETPQHMLPHHHEEQPYSWGRPVRRQDDSNDTTRQEADSNNLSGRRGGLLGGGLENGDGKANGHRHAHQKSNGNEVEREPSAGAVPDLILNPSQDGSIGASTVGGGDDINLLPSFDYSHYAADDESRVHAASPESRLGHMEPLHEDRPTETSWASLVASGANNVSPIRTAATPQRRGICDDEHAVLPTCDTVDVSCGGMQSMASFDGACRGNDLLETDQSMPIPSEAPDPPRLLHGIPTFFSALSQVFVTKVSAHPSGSHVLLISREALLFSYGRNQHGQLGNGRQEEHFAQHPAIVTPLLENGGKTIDCAAGVNHSLVIVQTVGERVGHLLKDRNGDADGNHDNNNWPPAVSKRVQSSSSSSPEKTSTPILAHHQVYAFGRNDYMKLGLNDPSSAPSAASPKQRSRRKNRNTTSAQPGVEKESGLEDDVLLPRSVRLGVTFTPYSHDHQEEEEESCNLPRRGIYAIAASDHHSAALVRTDAGLIELYTWGKASRGALGLGSYVREVVGLDPQRDGGEGTGKIAKPTLKKRLSALPRAVAIPNLIQSLSKRSVESTRAYPSSVSLGPECTSVLLSDGKVVTFGSSSDGLLGLGKDVETKIEPTEITFGPSSSSIAPTPIVSVSYGPRHAIAIAKDGTAFSWGLSDSGRLGYRPQGQDLLKGAQILKQAEKKGKSNKSEKRKRIIWSPRKIHFQENIPALVEACAGNDNTVFLTEEGDVLSCGRMSGRLGQGEIMSDVHHPAPMFGGLRLWQN